MKKSYCTVPGPKYKINKCIFMFPTEELVFVVIKLGLEKKSLACLSVEQRATSHILRR